MRSGRQVTLHKQTGQNRLCVHLLAEAAGIDYADAKARMFHFLIETPLSADLMRDTIRRIEERAVGQITGWRA